MAQKTQDEVVFDSFKQYPWLRDFCTYINRKEDELTWVEYYLRVAEIHWVNCLTSWNYIMYKAGMVDHVGLKGWKTNDDICPALTKNICMIRT